MPNKRPPFGALAETALSNNPYFVTGAGGMLQTVIFGFGGLHITDDGITQRNPVLPASWKSLTIKGVGRDQKTSMKQLVNRCGAVGKPVNRVAPTREERVSEIVVCKD